MDGRKDSQLTPYGPVMLGLIILIVGLNILDSLFTMVILDTGGREVNPLVRLVISLYGDRFWLWKFIVVSASLVVLCLNRNFRFVKMTIWGISAVYATTVIYQIFLLS